MLLAIIVVDLVEALARRRTALPSTSRCLALIRLLFGVRRFALTLGDLKFSLIVI